MIDILIQTFGDYWDFYCRFLLRQWNLMTPTRYATLLIGIGLFGWLLMKNQDQQR